MQTYLQQEQGLVDVTLACDGNQQIRAHKVILSAGSLFLREIFSNARHPEPFIYLGGVEIKPLQKIVEYIYSGETNVNEEELEMFLKTAKKMRVNGLEKTRLSNKAEYIENELDASISREDVQNSEETKLRNDYEFKSVDNKFEVLVASEDVRSGTIDKSYGKNKAQGKVIAFEKVLVDDGYEIKPSTNEFIESKKVEELDNKFQELVVKVEDGSWDCTKCIKTRIQKSEVKRHADLHVKGIHPCTLCNKIVRTRHALREHVKTTHSDKSFSCGACGKTGMNQKQLHEHMLVHKPTSKIRTY